MTDADSTTVRPADSDDGVERSRVHARARVHSGADRELAPALEKAAPAEREERDGRRDRAEARHGPSIAKSDGSEEC